LKKSMVSIAYNSKNHHGASAEKKMEQAVQSLSEAYKEELATVAPDPDEIDLSKVKITKENE